MENPVRASADDICTDPQFRLIETFAYHPGQGVARRSRHMRRMQLSAQALGVRFERAAAEAKLNAITGPEPLRCRLTLDTYGRLELTTSPLPPSKGPWRVAIAETRLDSADPWLRHKSTRRAIYDTARANLPDGIDEVLFLNERDELCEGTITNLFVWSFESGRVTPPLSSGLLPGVLRQTLLATGRYTEKVLTLQDLRRARRIGVGNSLRGMIPVDYHGPRGPL